MNDNDLFDANGIFTQTEHYILRRILPEDQPFYQQLAQAETPAFPQNTSLTGSSSPAWEDLLAEDHLTCSILQRDAPSSFIWNIIFIIKKSEQSMFTLLSSLVKFCIFSAPDHISIILFVCVALCADAKDLGSFVQL